jgi:hypothetical protein
MAAHWRSLIQVKDLKFRACKQRDVHHLQSIVNANGLQPNGQQRPCDHLILGAPARYASENLFSQPYYQ